nr:hypothetical protein [Trentepohlia sp. YN1317]
MSKSICVICALGRENINRLNFFSGLYPVGKHMKKIFFVRRDFLQGSPIELQAIQSDNRRFFPFFCFFGARPQKNKKKEKKGEKNHGSMLKLGGEPQNEKKRIDEQYKKIGRLKKKKNRGFPLNREKTLLAVLQNTRLKITTLLFQRLVNLFFKVFQNIK